MLSLALLTRPLLSGVNGHLGNHYWDLLVSRDTVGKCASIAIYEETSTACVLGRTCWKASSFHRNLMEKPSCQLLPSCSSSKCKEKGPEMANGERQLI